MASIYKRGRVLWITWHNPVLRKNESQSTGLTDTPENRRIAEKASSRQQEAMDRMAEEVQKLNLRHDSIKNAFVHHKKNNAHKNVKTLRDYDRFYKKFTETYNENDPCTVINKLNVEDWINEIKKLPLQRNTIFGYYKQLSNFLNFLFEYNYIPMFKVNRNVRPRPEVKAKIIFTQEDIDKIFSNLETANKSSNFIAMINFAFYSGLRSSDLLSIKIEDIQLEKRILSYYSPKRKVPRRIGFHKELTPILKRHIGQRTEGRLLAYRSTDEMGKAFSRYLESLGIGSKGYSMRTFRKTFQTLATFYKMNPAVIDELVGYEASKTANKYYIRISIEMELNELKKYRRPKSGDSY